MTSDLDDLAARLARRLGRSVAIDDPQLRLLSYSEHYEIPDRVRLEALVARQVSPIAFDYLRRQRIHLWRGPSRVDAHPEIGLDHPRFGSPLRSSHAFLGYLWVIEDTPLSDEELALVEDAAREAVRILERRATAEEKADAELRSLVVLAVLGAPAERSRAAARLRALPVVAGRGFVVLAADADPVLVPSEDVLRMLDDGVAQLAPDVLAVVVPADVPLLVVGVRTAAEPDAETARVVRRLRERWQRSAPAGVVRLGIGGIGSPDGLADSARQASVAARMARRRGTDSAVWADSPVEALLEALTLRPIETALVPELASRIDARPAGELETVAAFFASGASVALAARALGLHRTTVYYRLSRFEEALGISLADRDTRLFVELWLRIRPAPDPVTRDRVL